MRRSIHPLHKGVTDFEAFSDPVGPPHSPGPHHLRYHARRAHRPRSVRHRGGLCVRPPRPAAAHGYYGGGRRGAVALRDDAQRRRIRRQRPRYGRSARPVLASRHPSVGGGRGGRVRDCCREGGVRRHWPQSLQPRHGGPGASFSSPFRPCCPAMRGPTRFPPPRPFPASGRRKVRRNGCRC